MARSYKNIVALVRSQFPAGTCVELVSMDDKNVPPIGTKGTVVAVDEIGSILTQCNWPWNEIQKLKVKM